MAWLGLDHNAAQHSGMSPTHAIMAWHATQATSNERLPRPTFHMLIHAAPMCPTMPSHAGAVGTGTPLAAHHLSKATQSLEEEPLLHKASGELGCLAVVRSPHGVAVRQCRLGTLSWHGMLPRPCAAPHAHMRKLSWHGHLVLSMSTVERPACRLPVQAPQSRPSRRRTLPQQLSRRSRQPRRRPQLLQWRPQLGLAALRAHSGSLHSARPLLRMQRGRTRFWPADRLLCLMYLLCLKSWQPAQLLMTRCCQLTSSQPFCQPSCPPPCPQLRSSQPSRPSQRRMWQRCQSLLPASQLNRQTPLAAAGPVAVAVVLQRCWAEPCCARRLGA